MKRLFIGASALLLLAGCKSVQVQAPQVADAPKPQQTLQEKKRALQAKQKASAPLPEVLGGIVKSDEWIIYKDKEQEEFKGHVSYDNGIYVFKAGYGLSDRLKNTFTARHNVYLKQHQPAGPTYEAYADYAQYNYKTGKGILKSTSSTPVRLRMSDLTQTITAHAKQIDFDTEKQTFVLTGNVDAKRTTAQGTQTLQADKATFKQTQNYIRLDGHATVADQARTLQADTIIYDGEHNQSRAFGARPLATGTTEQGTFAIIADNVTSDAQGNEITLDGQVQGWVVSPEVNANKLNRQI